MKERESQSGERRILAIDGGGIKGLIPASLLAQVEEVTDEKIVDHFDLIVGTSTGGIIALGLGLGVPAPEIRDFYREHGPGIFGAARRGRRAFFDDILRRAASIFSPKYTAKRLRAALESVFGDRTLGESKTRLVVPSFDPRCRAVYVFKTAHHARLQTDWREKVVDVALATAAAPTYFPQHSLRTGTALIDGGVWANNPVGLAVVEALGVLGWPRESLRVLSIGCSEVPTRLPENPGWLRLSPVLADLFLMGQSHGSLGTAKLLLASREKLLRIQPVVPAGMYELDSVEQLEDLQGIGASLARENLPRIRDEFLQFPRSEFSPLYGQIHTDGAT